MCHSFYLRNWLSVEFRWCFVSCFFLSIFCYQIGSVLRILLKNSFLTRQFLLFCVIPFSTSFFPLCECFSNLILSRFSLEFGKPFHI